MQSPDPSAFLQSLPVFTEFADVADVTRYRPMPEGWALAVADVVSSGVAIAEGKYKLVNMGGAAVITAVLNAIGQRDYPFVFGGDGSAIAVPPDHLDAARSFRPVLPVEPGAGGERQDRVGHRGSGTKG